MAKKAIAAILLLVISAWAEMAMAPMLAMHAGHMRPGHEMAADMPTDHGMDRHAGHAHMARLPCCPQLHRIETETASEMIAGSSSCADPHSCCFQQGPQSVPAPVSDRQKLAREIAPAATATTSPAVEASNRFMERGILALRPPPNLFGVMLRI
ncbi:MAG: hypothetical protein WCC04_10450 [Terriglobales bacterium]